MTCKACNGLKTVCDCWPDCADCDRADGHYCTQVPCPLCSSDVKITREEVRQYIDLSIYLGDWRTSAHIANEYLKALDALEAIRKHQTIIGGTLAEHSVTWKIANDFLKERQ